MHDPVEALRRDARRWAKAYAALVESLMAEGVPEAVARYEARAALHASQLAGLLAPRDRDEPTP